MTFIQKSSGGLLLVFCLFLSGCTTILQQTESGFLGDYSQLRKTEQYPNSRIYQSPDFGAVQLAQVVEIKLVPFEIWINQDNPGTAGTINAEQLTKLHRYFHHKLKQGLEANYQVVDTAGENTLIIRGAFSGIKLSKPELSVSDFVPIRLVLNAGNAGYLYTTDQKDLISEVSIEAEFLLGKNTSRVFAMTASKQLDLTVSQSSEGNFKAVTDVLDVWVDNFILKLAEIQQK